MSDPMTSKGVTGDRAMARALAQVAAAAPAAPTRNATNPAREPSPADVASVSGVAAQLSAQKSLGPPVDAERVAQIKRAIANGTFPILPATIADRILALRYDWMSNDR